MSQTDPRPPAADGERALPEEIVKAIRFLTETCLFANRFNDAALINRKMRDAVEALTASILSRLTAAEAGREEWEQVAKVEASQRRRAMAELAEIQGGECCDGYEGQIAVLQQVVKDKGQALDAALARVETLEKRVNTALDDACRMSAILLMAGEMSPQERRTAQAVANGLAAKVRAALTEAQPKGDQ